MLANKADRSGFQELSKARCTMMAVNVCQRRLFNGWGGLSGWSLTGLIGNG